MAALTSSSPIERSCHGQKVGAKHYLYRNERNGVFTDVIGKSNLKGNKFDAESAVGGYGTDRDPDLFVADAQRRAAATPDSV